MGVGGWFRRNNTALVRRFLADKALLSGIVNLPGCWFAVGAVGGGAVGDLSFGSTD
ncbi:MAG: hypothetical protein ICV80_11180 [Microcoleus sp. T1-bin1]|nr:hypothetical protein [Microcoleus sp. T1-bin1]